MKEGKRGQSAHLRKNTELFAGLKSWKEGKRRKERKRPVRLSGGKENRVARKGEADPPCTKLLTGGRGKGQGMEIWEKTRRWHRTPEKNKGKVSPPQRRKREGKRRENRRQPLKGANTLGTHVRVQKKRKCVLLLLFYSGGGEERGKFHIL